MHDNQDVVNVVIPTVGRWDFVHQSLDAIDAQEQVEMRPIVVNDSGDPEPAEITNRCHVVRTTGRIGEGAARTAGVAACETEYLAFCDDDDRWEPTKIRKQLDAIAAAGGGEKWCLVGATRVNEHDKNVGEWSLATMVELQKRGELNRRLMTHNPVPAGPSSVLVHSALLARVGGWNVEMKYFADWDAWIRLSTAADPVLVDESLVNYRVWDGQMVSDRRAAWGALDQIRTNHAARRTELGVGPLDDRIIAWILQGELSTEGRRIAGLKEAATRVIPRSTSDLGAFKYYIEEARERLTSKK